MKKLLIATLIMLLCISSTTFAELDLTGLSFKELLAAQQQVNEALWASDGWQEVEVPSGVYQIGAEIPAGRWTISGITGNWTIYQSFVNGEGENIVDYGMMKNPTTVELIEGHWIKIGIAPAIFTPTVASFSFSFDESIVTNTPEPTAEPTPESANETEDVSRQPEAEAAVSITYDELQKGAKGEKVKDLQNKLISKGYLSGGADGDFGGKTETAVKEFQMANGLEATGIADNAMQQLLFYVEPIDLSNTVLTIGSKGEEVKAAQQRLIELNYLKGSADGSFGRTTATAVKNYQITAELPVTGEINATTMDSLMSSDAPKAIVYKSMKYKELSRNPDAYVGTHYKFNGTINWISENVNDAASSYTTVILGINTKGKYNDLVYIEYDRQEGETRYLENDRVVVYAEFIGLYSYEAISGATITCPRFELDKLELR